MSSTRPAAQPGQSPRKSGLCFFTGLPVVVVAAAAAAAVAGAVTVDVVLAVTPAVGVWEDEQVRTGVSGETGCRPCGWWSYLQPPAWEMVLLFPIFRTPPAQNGLLLNL